MKPVVGVMIICLLGIFASAEVSFDVEDGDSTPPASLLAKSAVVPTEEMVTGGPAPPPPPPPDPAALAMAMAMKEKAEKGKEKTAKNIRESARKSKKREAWRKRQAAKLAKIKNEANAKIAKEAKQKAKVIAFSHKKELQVKAKQMKIKAKVKKLKAASMIKVKKLRAKNKLTTKRMHAKMAALKKSTEEKTTKLMAKVKAEIAIKQAKATAKRTLTLAKITAETAKKKAAVTAKFLAEKKAIADRFAKKQLSRDKEAQTRKTFKGLLAAKSAKHKQALAAEDQKAAKKRTALATKEMAHKSKMEATFRKRMELARAGHFPGGEHVIRYARRQEELVHQLKREATRRARDKVIASKKKFRSMEQKSTKAVNQLARAELHVMRKVSKGAAHNTASNTAVRDAWSLAMGQKPSKPQAEALRLVNEERDTPSTDLLAAWKMAVGKHLPKAPTGTKPSRKTVQAFSEALEASPQQDARRVARESIRTAWQGAVGRTPQISAAVAEALHFAPTAGPPQFGRHPPGASGSRAHPLASLAPGDEVDASLAAGAAVKGIPGSAPVLKGGGAWKAHGDADPEDAAKEAMESVLVRAHEMAKPVVAVSVKPKQAKHRMKRAKPSMAKVHVEEPVITAKQHVPKAKRSAAIMAKLKEIESVRARMMLHGKTKAAHKAAVTVVGAATSLDMEAVKAAPSQLKKKPSDLVEEGTNKRRPGTTTATKHSGVAATKAQGFGVAVALAVIAML